MSSREPLWYCHECHAEMRPLMVPDPHCASCNGTFVEKIEESDDPRAFQEAGPTFDDGPPLPGFDQFLMNLGQLFNPAARPQSPPTTSGAPHLTSSPSTTNTLNGGSGFRVELNRTTPGRGTRTFVLGGPPMLGRTRQDTAADEGPSIAGPLMAQYLLSMLAQRAQRDGRDNPLASLGFNLMGDMPENGRWGDYVFNQEGKSAYLDFWGDESGRPVPATQEVMDKLDRQVLSLLTAPLLQHDCAVCKEQFSLTGATSDDEPDQVVVTLPCKHPFHESCITPWLTSSGTCPVCRYQLVPQPEHHSAGAPGGSGPPGSPSNRSPPPPGGGNPAGGGVGGVLNSLFGAMSQAGQGNSSGSAGTRNSSGTSQSQSGDHNAHDDLPGGWVD
ncbi:hypothetical protein EVG20_g1667 [Dentipellis fragilis]|uniref:RING-type domain-containing protein n=1 Tax=Dentipellis fragilis TaxID=205917 RepID=A0A4Y9ZD47_9AGAM|nr:hypothetical protein EVG20_g1667 [Dentipellis fragilis]